MGGKRYISPHYVNYNEYDTGDYLLDYSTIPNTPSLIYDPRRGERVTKDGIVVSELDLEEKRYVRKASTIAELMEKQDHAPYRSQYEARLWSAITSAGRLVSAPKSLLIEAYNFYRLANAIKDKHELKGKSLHYSDPRYVLAVLFVLAMKRGFYEVAERIKRYPCGENNEPCYVTKRRGDPKFRSHLSVVQRYYSVIYNSSNKRRIKDYILHIGHTMYLPPELVNEALRITDQVKKTVSGRRVSTIASVVYYLASLKLYGEDTARSIADMIREMTNTTMSSFTSMLSTVKRFLDQQEGEY